MRHTLHFGCSFLSQHASYQWNFESLIIICHAWLALWYAHAIVRFGYKLRTAQILQHFPIFPWSLELLEPKGLGWRSIWRLLTIPGSNLLHFFFYKEKVFPGARFEPCTFCSKNECTDHWTLPLSQLTKCGKNANKCFHQNVKCKKMLMLKYNWIVCSKCKTYQSTVNLAVNQIK